MEKRGKTDAYSFNVTGEQRPLTFISDNDSQSRTILPSREHLTLSGEVFLLPQLRKAETTGI